MPDPLSREMLKRKVLDRWENEGGKLCVDQPGVMKSGLSREHTSKDKATQPFSKSGSSRSKRGKLTTQPED